MVCLIVTHISYPFGGGEEFTKQTMDWTRDTFVWISFSTKVTLHTIFSVEKSGNCYYINLQGGFNEKVVCEWIKLVNPKLIHTQGYNSDKVVTIAKSLKTPVLWGFHFWHGLVELSPKTYNRDILDNLDLHQLSLQASLTQEFGVYSYVASEFVAEVVNRLGGPLLTTVLPSSSKSRNYLSRSQQGKGRFITQINIHALKGGQVFLNLIKAFPERRFQCIQTEPHSTKLDSTIEQAMKVDDRNLFLGRTNDILTVYRRTSILIIPSLVDETFCRVAIEGMMNGIPILSTGKGNISRLLGTEYSHYILEDTNVKGWCKAVKTLDDMREYRKYSKYLKGRYELFSEKVCKQQFTQLLSTVTSYRKNIMFVAPFCDQGLGIQVRYYIELFASKGFNVSVFSYKPYLGSIEDMQKDAKEWNVDFPVYYSSNTRENINLANIENFTSQHNIGSVILPETCWDKVFELGRWFRQKHIHCYAVPNVEILRKDELYKHHCFYKILTPNNTCKQVFTQYGFKNVEHIGFAIPPKFKSTQSPQPSFLCIGGFNAYTRKQVHKVCQAFSNLSYSLTVTIQGNHTNLLDPYRQCSNITIIESHLVYKDIMDLYYKHDVCIHVSSHEGIGLGFYEALSTGTPVLTLNTPPHNEIITEGLNGWLINCTYKPMRDNSESFLQEAHFSIDELCVKVKQIVLCEDFQKLNKTLQQSYMKIIQAYSKDIFFAIN